MIALLLSASAWAQTTIATMKTAIAEGGTVSIRIAWTGDGTITANGKEFIIEGILRVQVPDDQIITVAATGNITLTELTCRSNQLTELDLSNCPVLTKLDCCDNHLTNLDVLKCTALTELSCSNNQLAELDLSNCPVLTKLDCYDNHLTNLDVLKCTALTELSCSNNQLAELSLSPSQNLTQLYCRSNQLTNLEVSMCTALKTLLCSENQLTSLDVSMCTALGVLDCKNNQLTSLNMTKNTALKTLYCERNQLIDLNVSKCTELTILHAINQTITLPEAPTTGNSLTIANPITYNGSKVANIIGAAYSSGNISWSGLTGASGDATFLFTTTLPSNMNGGAFSGTVTQPWVFGLSQYTIIAHANNNAFGTVSGGGDFDEDTEVTVTATPKPGYRFVNWTEAGNPVSTNIGYTFTISKNRTLVANFEAIPAATYSIAVSSNNTNQGTVSGGGTFDEGTEATVTATPKSGYRFVNWTEAGNPVSTNTSYTFTVSKNRTLVANFEAIPATTYTITVSSNNTNQGTVSGGGTFDEGAEATVTATPKSGYRFVNWTEAGNPVSTNTSYTFTVSKNRTLVANFEVVSVVIEEPDPIGEDGKGSIDFSLEIPADATITGTFELKLPEGYTLDESATKLIEALAGHFDLIITFKGGNVWQIEIKSNGLRAATAATLTKVMDIAYTVDPTVPKGKYDIEISHIELDLSDGTSINSETITVITEVAQSGTGIDDLRAAPQIWSANGQAHILLPEATNVQIVSIVGVTVYKEQLPGGTHSVALSPGVYIVKAGSVVRKIRN